MTPDHVTALILQYRYLILFPLSFIEGPIVALIAGTLAAVGYFNVWALLVFFFARDMIMDGFYYSLGYWGGNTPFAQKIMRKLGVKTEHLDQVREIWATKAGRTMFIGKLSYGVASSFVVLAGTVKMPLKKFFGWGAIVAVVEYGGLLFLGYFFGNTIKGLTTHVVTILQYGTIAISVAGIIYYILAWRARKALQKETETKEG